MATTHMLLRGAEVFAPAPLGKQDVLLCRGKVIAIEEDLSRFAALKDAETVDLAGRTLVPGVIDNHVHILGGGTAGPISRGPEIFLSELTLVGTTTVVGIMGDGLTRHLASLLAKARALTREGITAYIWSGAYPYPPPHLCGGAQWDLLYIPEVLGVGEIAISEELGTQPTVPELARLLHVPVHVHGDPHPKYQLHGQILDSGICHGGKQCQMRSTSGHRANALVHFHGPERLLRRRTTLRRPGASRNHVLPSLG